MIFLFQVFFFLKFAANASLNCSDDQSFKVQNISISGNSKTKSRVIFRELGFHENSIVCEEVILNGIGRIKRMSLFSSVSYRLNKTDIENTYNLDVIVDEKWTTIPILKINSGGGVSQITLGAYDPNVAGEFLESGAQYENLAGAGSGVIWFKNPRLFDKNQGLDFQYWNTKRIRIKYDQDSNSPEIKSGFLQEREKVYVDYFKEYSPSKVIRFSLDYNSDQFSTDILPNSVIDKVGTDPVLPPSTKLVISKIGFESGQINGDSHSLEGSMLGVYLGYAQPLNSRVESFIQADLSYNIFKSLTPNWQLAQRLMFGSTTSEVLQYWYYLGGLDRIRGFSDNRFSGRHFGLSNSELRYLILQKPKLILQSATFLDFAIIGDRIVDLNQIHAASFGFGVRILLPQFYRFVVRLDYAQPIIKKDTMNISLGVQQFF